MNGLQNTILKSTILGFLSLAAGTFTYVIGSTIVKVAEHETKIQLLTQDINYIKVTVTDIRNSMPK
jgi:hypothetical protein